MNEPETWDSIHIPMELDVAHFTKTYRELWCRISNLPSPWCSARIRADSADSTEFRGLHMDPHYSARIRIIPCGSTLFRVDPRYSVRIRIIPRGSARNVN